MTNQLRAKPKYVCPDHPEELVNLYDVDCNRIYCSHCPVEHQKHQIFRIPDLRDEIEELKSIIDRVISGGADCKR